MTEYKVITLPLAEEDIADQTVYILRVFHMLVDSREKILKIFRV